MAKTMATKGTVTVVELVLAQSYELAALVNLLERKGVLTQGEVLEEIRRLRASRGPRQGDVASFVSLPEHLALEASGLRAWSHRCAPQIRILGATKDHILLRPTLRNRKGLADRVGYPL